MSLVMAMHRYRALNVSMVAIVMLVAYEYLAVATAMPFNFVGNKLWTFR